MADVVATLQRVGFRGPALKTAWAIVQRESGGNPRAFNGNAATGDLSYGWGQVNMLGALGPARRKQFGLKRNEDLFDPLVNARAMYVLSKGGRDFGPWGVGPTAYRPTAPLDTSRFPGAREQGVTPQAGLAAPAVAFPGVQAPGRPASPAVVARQFDRLAKSYGFPSFAKAYGLDPKQAKALLAQTIPVPAPVGEGKFVFKAQPPAPKKAAGRGVAELFYDPAGKGRQWDEGKAIDPIGGHADHVHVSFSTPETALKLISVAQDMGLSVRGNPYVNHPDGGSTATSFHPRLFPGSYSGKQLGQAVDVSGPADRMMRYFELARAYIS